MGVSCSAVYQGTALCVPCPSMHRDTEALVLAFKEFRVLRVAKCTPPETSKNTKAAAVDASLAGFWELAVCLPWPFPALPHHGGRGGQEKGEWVQGEVARVGGATRTYRETTKGFVISPGTQPEGRASMCSCPCNYVT